MAKPFPVGHCPTCRARMPRAVSLLAATVIQHIEHECRFEGCGERVALAKVEEHRRACTFRLFTCPSNKCLQKISLVNVMDHVMNECKYFWPIQTVSGSSCGEILPL